MKNKKTEYKAVITGATRGIGFAIAEKLLADGMKVVATGTHQKPSCPNGCIYRQVNFLNDDETDDFISFLKKEGGDVLVNNAGINRIGEFSEIPSKDFDEIIKVNLKAPFLLSQAVIPNMKSNNWGRIVNISSILGKISKEFRASYSSSKFGIDGMTAALSAELSEYGILANCVGPGFIKTDLTAKMLGEAGIKEIGKQIPMKRFGNAKEIAELVSWLVSDSNTYLTGQNILIDGGFYRI